MSDQASDFQPGDLVRYVPYHAHNDIAHPDCENGVVTSTNDYLVFVRFGADSHSKGCHRERLVYTGMPA